MSNVIKLTNDEKEMLEEFEAVSEDALTIGENLDAFHSHGVDVNNRIIYMGSESVHNDEESGTDTVMAEKFIKNLSMLNALSHEDVTVIMNNIGGDVIHGMAIYDAIKLSESKVTIKVFGHAMSMGAIILQAADSRLMAPNAKLMIHYGNTSVSATHKSSVRWLRENAKHNKWMEDLFMARIQAKKPRFKQAMLEKWLDFDTYMSAKEALEYNLCDGIVESKRAGKLG